MERIMEHRRRVNWMFGRIMVFALLFAVQPTFSGFQFSLFSSARAQVAGMNTLSLLQMPSSARTAALGVDYLSIFSPQDMQVGIDNPSFINADYNGRLSINYVGLFAGSNFGTVAYGRTFDRFGFIVTFALIFKIIKHYCSKK